MQLVTYSQLCLGEVGVFSRSIWGAKGTLAQLCWFRFCLCILKIQESGFYRSKKWKGGARVVQPPFLLMLPILVFYPFSLLSLRFWAYRLNKLSLFSITNTFGSNMGMASFSSCKRVMSSSVGLRSRV